MTTDMLAPDLILAPAAPEELSPLALLTIKPEEYVAQVFAPFRTKLETLKAEADTIHFEDTRMFDAPHRYVDIGTSAGMAIAVKYRAAFRDDVRVEAEKTRVARKAPILQIGKLLDSTNKAIADSASEYEFKFDNAIKAEEKRKADIKAAKERAEAERIGAIKAAIEAIRALPARAVGKSAEELRALLERVAARVITKEEFDQFDGEAQIALDAAGEELVAMYGAAQRAEQAAAEAEAARAAEVARVAAEQAAADQRRADEAAENARVAAENQRIAAENAAAAQRLADQQAALELAARQQREQAEAAAKAEEARRAEAARLEQVERDRLAAEAQAKIDAQLAEIAAAAKLLAEQQAAADARDAAALQALADEQVAAEQHDAAAAPAPASAEPEPAPQASIYSEPLMADSPIGRSHVLRSPPPELCPAIDMLDSLSDTGPSDAEIIAFGAEHDMEIDELIPRFERFIADARAGALAAAA